MTNQNYKVKSCEQLKQGGFDFEIQDDYHYINQRYASIKITKMLKIQTIKGLRI